MAWSPPRCHRLGRLTRRDSTRPEPSPISDDDLDIIETVRTATTMVVTHSSSTTMSEAATCTSTAGITPRRSETVFPGLRTSPPGLSSGSRGVQCPTARQDVRERRSVRHALSGRREAGQQRERESERAPIRGRARTRTNLFTSKAQPPHSDRRRRVP
eukprot:2885908-Rhodomonas_salina.1